jgi:integrase
VGKRRTRCFRGGQSVADSLITEFRRELPFQGYAPTTAHVSGYHVQAFLRAQPEPFPACFTYQAVIAYLSELRSTPPRLRQKAQREASTVNNVMKSLKRFGDWAASRDLLPANPIASLRGLPESNRVFLAPPLETMATILAAAAEHGETEELQARNHALLSLLADVGMRAAEALGIDMADVDLEDNRLTLRKTKEDVERWAALNPPVVRSLRRYLALRRAMPGEHALFVDAHGRRMSYIALRNMLGKLRRKLELTLTPHDFRRFALTDMWGSGMDEMDVRAISGHTSARNLMPYIRAAVYKRAVKSHRRHSPLAALERRG